MNTESQNSQKVPMVVITPLARTQGWARFFSILGFIIVALMALQGLMLTGGPVPFGGVISIVFAALYFYPALKLSQYASRIAILRFTQTEAALVAAMEAQRSFWIFTGIKPA